MTVLSIGLILVGCFFFLAGTVGLLRFPDVYSRLHALTKADILGLGFLLLGLAVQASSWMVVLKLFIVWWLALTASAAASHLVARAALAEGVEP